MNNNPIIVLIIYQAKPGMEDMAKQELTSLIESAVSEPFCAGINLHQDTDDPSRFMLYEKWMNKDYYIGEHMETSHIKDFIHKAMNFLVAPPEISFWKGLWRTTETENQ